ncbi:MAG: (Fe-S)-binding protein [Euryarchaeota archaeon]|nr:(Fe-S)-binding protein [Euryarchaeota archaeon]
MTDYIDAKNLKLSKKDMMTCTMCGFCKSVCPTFEGVGKDTGVARGRVILSYGLLMKDIPADDSVIEALYQCTTCMDCERRCPSKIKVVDIVERARKDLVDAGHILPKHRKIVDNIRTYGNPYGEELSVSEALGEEPKRAKIGYFAGCTSAHRNPKIAQATLSILKKLGEDYTVLNETCCGSVLSRIGLEKDAMHQMQLNIDAIVEQGVEEVLFSCAGCYRMFKEEYPLHVDVPFKVRHISEYLADKDLDLGKLDKKITYHDPCHLGRHAHVYNAPREVLASIPGVEFKEMSHTTEEARCCGGGGGVRSAYPELSEDIAGRRVDQAEFAEILVTCCPFCVTNLRAGSEKNKSDIKICDLVELVEPLL